MLLLHVTGVTGQVRSLKMSEGKRGERKKERKRPECLHHISSPDYNSQKLLGQKKNWLHLVEYVSSIECCRDDAFTDVKLCRRTKRENLPT